MEETSPRLKWERLGSEHGPDLKLFRIRFDLMRNPRNGASERMVVLEAADAANVVAVTDAGTILFVHQYRFGTEAYTLELPGGLVDSEEPHEAAAHRELLEEAGAKAERWTHLGSIPSNPVFMDAYIHHWLAEGITLGYPQQLDSGEEVELVELPIAEVKARLLRGQFEHPHTVNALLRYFVHVGEME